MPTAFEYAYLPQYGVEPFLDTAEGGANVTGDNLLITLWTAEDKGGEPPDPYVQFGSLVRPSATNTNELANIRTAYGPAMHSRCSARFYFGADELEWPLCAVLNPPDDLKQQLVNAVRYIGDDASDPADFANYEVLRSLEGCYSWQIPQMAGSVDAINSTLTSGFFQAMFSAYIVLSPWGNGASIVLPFLRTNGADGQVPEFFDTSTVAGVKAMIAAVNRGEFFVAALIAAEDAASFCEIRWPHSVARG